jgi:RsiW-degrading membrane proteinase PrsW (M82 family)
MKPESREKTIWNGLADYCTRPVAALLFFIYIRDKYEKEPPQMLFRALGLGHWLFSRYDSRAYPERVPGFFRWLAEYVLACFCVAAFTEESFKLLALYLLVWRSVLF